MKRRWIFVRKITILFCTLALAACIAAAAWVSAKNMDKFDSWNIPDGMSAVFRYEDRIYGTSWVMPSLEKTEWGKLEYVGKIVSCVAWDELPKQNFQSNGIRGCGIYKIEGDDDRLYLRFFSSESERGYITYMEWEALHEWYETVDWEAAARGEH